jgi:hypothetical protein
MAAIGDPKSLSRVERYCRDVSPILWDYKEPGPEFSNSATKVYVAIADNLAKVDKQKSVTMLNHALKIANNLDTRQQVITSLNKLGIDIGADAARDGFITHWYLIGPFPWDETENPLDKTFVNEPDVDLSKSYGVADRLLKWMEYAGERGMIDLANLFGRDEYVSAYAYAEVILPEERDLLLKIGSNDGFKCWFNGEVVGRFDGGRGWAPDQDIFRVKTKEGVNTILLKISQLGASWAFSARLTELKDSPIDLTSLSSY